ncbi:hypothetical protein GCM10009850_074900 [Nonomuraea monospora]|uniref:Uncharacterized protein n=1 Tax=Nonomuraea monospora TaxID=568818 RepID=A0ABN3CRF3_9ACTN
MAADTFAVTAGQDTVVDETLFDGSTLKLKVIDARTGFSGNKRPQSMSSVDPTRRFEA